jgi:hypothetical protein
MTLKTSAVTSQPALSFMGVAHRLPFMSPEIPTALGHLLRRRPSVHLGTVAHG